MTLYKCLKDEDTPLLIFVTRYQVRPIGRIKWFRLCISTWNNLFLSFLFSIDATRQDGMGRLVNDAQAGDTANNCKITVVDVSSRPHLCLFAIRDIQEGEELRYDYGVPNLPWRRTHRTGRTKDNANGKCRNTCIDAIFCWPTLLFS